MENREEETTLSFLRERYHDLTEGLKSCRNKLEIRYLEISECDNRILKREIFNGFRRLIHLNLNDCNIEILESSVFDNLMNLKLINLSNNCIKSMASNIFRMNFNLQTVILKNNLLDNIGMALFSGVIHLEILDLSYNNISGLIFLNLNCQNLKELYLNNNRITELRPAAFFFLPKLTCLILSNNTIQVLGEHVFVNLKRLQYLNLDGNLIRLVSKHCFRELRRLNTLCLGNYCVVSSKAFKYCENLLILKLTVSISKCVDSIKNLKSLTQLDIVFNEHQFSWTHNFRKIIFGFKSLQILKLVFHKIHEIHFGNFSKLKSLVYLHIECIEPSNYVHEFNLSQMLPNSSNLEHLALIMLNSFTIDYLCEALRRLKYLNLSGLKNACFPASFSNCVLLEYLDLSFSEITSISEYTLVNLVNLRILQLQHSKLEVLETRVFRYNRQLQYLNCYHCCIKSIEGGVFSNLNYLMEVNLSHNPVQISSDRRVYGLNETCRFIIH